MSDKRCVARLLQERNKNLKVAPDIHHFPTGPFNWYVIEEAGRLTLVDAGFPGHFNTFMQGLAELGREIKDVEAIVLTHAHADHIGFAERVRQLSKAPVFVHAADLEKSRRRLQLPWVGLLTNAWRPYTATMLANATMNGVFSGPPVAEAHPIADGQELDVPGRPIALHVAGHTPGEIALHLPRRNVLISGDTLVTRNLYTGRSGEPMVPNEGLNYDRVAAGRNLDRFGGLGRLTMLPGHGRPWTGEVMQAVVQAREAMVKKVEQQLPTDLANPSPPGND